MSDTADRPSGHAAGAREDTGRPDQAGGGARETLRRTPLHAEHLAAGARMMPFAGFEMPVQYTSIKAEHVAVRERAGLFDVSHMGQIQLRGSRAAELAERLLTCEVVSLGIGRARYGLLLAEDGGCLDDVMLTRLADDVFFLCVNAANVETVWEHVRAHRIEGVECSNRSDETALLALQGPAARTLLARIAREETLPKRFRVSETTVADLPVLVSGTGYTGSPGYELYVAAEHAAALWQALLEAGAPEDVRPAGLGARDTLRLEAALPLYGNELDRETTPFEAGLARFVKSLERDFIGARALAARADTPDPRRLVGFEVIGRGIARTGHPIRRAGEPIGRVTSGTMSPSLGKSIGLGYVPRSSSEVGTDLEIDVRGRAVEARVVPTPFI